MKTSWRSDAAWTAAALLAADAYRPFSLSGLAHGTVGGSAEERGPPRRERLFWLAVVLATALAVLGPGRRGRRGVAGRA